MMWAGSEVGPAIELLRGRSWESARAEMQAWCRSLPESLTELAARWQVRPTGERAWAGFEGIAVPVTRIDHSPAVLKINFSLERRDRENEVLARWAGRHAADLLERDDARHARLVERLGRASLLDLPDPVEAMQIAGHVAVQLAIEPPPGLPRMTDAAHKIAVRLEADSVGTASRLRSVTKRDVEEAVATYRELGPEQADSLLHGDLHGRNVLSRDGCWAAIDPLGEVGEVALEALSALRDRWTSLPAEPRPRAALLDRLQAFADGSGAARERVLAWTQARCVRAALGRPEDDQGGLHAWVVRTLSPAG